MISQERVQELVHKAIEARKRAYTPYSKFNVGAVVIDTSGNEITGCNVENASYGLTLCAERAALCRAVADGTRRFSALAVVCSGNAPVPPCGACLQVLAEFCPPGLPVVMAAAGRPPKIARYTLGALLPRAFCLKP